MKIGNITINIKKGDITDEQVGAIVNAANNTLLGGGGVDGAIHRKGGATILEQCKKHSGCPTGEARLTTAGNLPSRYVIHTVGPIFGSHKGMEAKLLYNAYYNSLKLATEYKLRTVSFPAISAGAYGYPLVESVKIARQTVEDFSKLDSSIVEINFILFSEENYKTYILNFM